MRCRDCAKFVELDPGEVEADVSVESTEVHGIVECASVAGEVRISVLCAECSSELKEATLEVNLDVELEHSEDCTGPELDVEFSPESAEKFEPPKAKRQTHFYGAAGTATVTCQSCESKVDEVDWSDYVKSSEMDEC